MFFEGMRAERKLVETASLHLAHRCYLGCALDEPLPDHSSLSKIRQRLGLLIFRCFFDHVVQLCFDAGLVWGKELRFDATWVRANVVKPGTSGRSHPCSPRYFPHALGPARRCSPARPAFFNRLAASLDPRALALVNPRHFHCPFDRYEASLQPHRYWCAES